MYTGGMKLFNKKKVVYELTPKMKKNILFLLLFMFVCLVSAHSQMYEVDVNTWSYYADNFIQEKVFGDYDENRYCERYSSCDESKNVAVMYYCFECSVNETACGGVSFRYWGKDLDDISDDRFFIFIDAELRKGTFVTFFVNPSNGQVRMTSYWPIQNIEEKNFPECETIRLELGVEQNLHAFDVREDTARIQIYNKSGNEYASTPWENPTSSEKSLPPVLYISKEINLLKSLCLFYVYMFSVSFE